MSSNSNNGQQVLEAESAQAETSENARKSYKPTLTGAPPMTGFTLCRMPMQSFGVAMPPALH